jgi:hypothetical protein
MNRSDQEISDELRQLYAIPVLQRADAQTQLLLADDAELRRRHPEILAPPTEILAPQILANDFLVLSILIYFSLPRCVGLVMLWQW